MGQLRLLELALIHAYRNIHIDVNCIINRFAKNQIEIKFTNIHYKSICILHISLYYTYYQITYITIIK